MFKVKTDKEFLDSFKEVINNIEKVSDIFKSEDKEISAIEFGDWNVIVNQTKKDFNKLINEANNRIKTK